MACSETQGSQSESNSQLSNQVGRSIETTVSIFSGIEFQISGPNRDAYCRPWCVASGLS